MEQRRLGYCGRPGDSGIHTRVKVVRFGGGIVQLLANLVGIGPASREELCPRAVITVHMYSCEHRTLNRTVDQGAL